MKPELCDEPHKSFRIHEVHIIIIPLSAVSQLGSTRTVASFIHPPVPFAACDWTSSAAIISRGRGYDVSLRVTRV